MIEVTRDPGYSEKPIHPLADRLPGKSYQAGEYLLELGGGAITDSYLKGSI